MDGICTSCRKKIIYVSDGAYCLRCGKPLKEETEEYCRDCAKNNADARFNIDQGRSMWVHREPVSGAVYRYKYKNRRRFGRVFAQNLADTYAVQIHKWQIDEIIPVPLHSSRRRKRGFNQAEIVALELGKRCGLPVRTDVLYRIRRTVPQKMLGRQERMRNLRGAFGVSTHWESCKNILLIDDIYTTGATLKCASRVLKKAGAQKVFFLTISIGQGI